MPNRFREVVAPVSPFVGLIETTQDALLIFEAARRAVIPRITRRLLESEKVLIKSGAVFVFDELESGIKRWTDGLVWSPSRILSNFIIYREANERTDRHPPRPRSKKGHQAVTPQLVKSHHHHASSSSSQVKIVCPKDAAGGIATQEDRERELVGSLSTSGKYKTQGLIKKTISVHINGVAQHLVSYYNMEDALSGKLRTPSSFPELASLTIHPDLVGLTVP
ncbi:Gti1/Pac2 family-domain-containing protein [Mrakia frigida]|uniref:Gti1/Pac2 family protein n=1 Tax=Mrakia frigida TaxID=29902 RepID=UPI003FCC1DC8